MSPIATAEQHLECAAHIVCSGCEIPGACTQTLETFDEKWNIYEQRLPDGRDLGVAEYTGFYASGCSSCP